MIAKSNITSHWYAGRWGGLQGVARPVFYRARSLAETKIPLPLLYAPFSSHPDTDALISVAAWTQAPVAFPDGDTINIADSYTWTLVKDRAGIKVYMRSIEGTDSKEVKAVMEVAAPFEEVARLVNTSSRNHEWINVFRKSENITPESGDVYYEYTVLDLPFVATDRDLYLRIDFVQTSSGFLRGFTCVPDYKPAHPDLVRMDHFYGYWAGKMVDKKPHPDHAYPVHRTGCRDQRKICQQLCGRRLL